MTRLEPVLAGRRLSRSRLRGAGRIGFAGLVMALCLVSVSYGQTIYEVVKALDAPYRNGANPYAGLIQATDGSFYGTTAYGGAFSAGNVFKIDATGTLTTV